MRLKELREQKNESQQKLAMILNISQTMISRYEKGQAYPDIETLMAIAKHYNVSVDYLIGFSDDKLPYTKRLKIQGKPESASKTFRLPLDLVENLYRIAYRNNLSLNQIVIQCLNYALHEIDTTGEEKLDNN